MVITGASASGAARVGPEQAWAWGLTSRTPGAGFQGEELPLLLSELQALGRCLVYVRICSLD